MKPDEFATRFGKVVKSYTYSDASGTHRDVTVELVNSEGKQEEVTAEFANLANSGENPRWELWEVNNYFSPLDDDEGFRAITGLYPCLQRPSPGP